MGCEINLRVDETDPVKCTHTHIKEIFSDFDSFKVSVDADNKVNEIILRSTPMTTNPFHICSYLVLSFVNLNHLHCDDKGALYLHHHHRHHHHTNCLDMHECGYLMC